MAIALLSITITLLFHGTNHTKCHGNEAITVLMSAQSPLFCFSTDATDNVHLIDRRFIDVLRCIIGRRVFLT